MTKGVTNEKRKYSVGYFSAYYRGLECFRRGSSSKNKFPATLDVYYGWEWSPWCEDDFAGMNNGSLNWPTRVLLHMVGFIEELAKAMKQKVWAYPTEFPEPLITALKAMRLAVILLRPTPLAETVQCGTN